MSNTAIEVRGYDRSLLHITDVMRRHKALLELRATMLKKQPGMLGYKYDWTKAQISNQIRQDPFIGLCLKTSRLSTGDAITVLDCMAPGESNANSMIQLDFFIARLMEFNGDSVVRSSDFLSLRTDLGRIQEGFTYA